MREGGGVWSAMHQLGVERGRNVALKPHLHEHVVGHPEGWVTGRNAGALPPAGRLRDAEDAVPARRAASRKAAAGTPPAGRSAGGTTPESRIQDAGGAGRRGACGCRAPAALSSPRRCRTRFPTTDTAARCCSILPVRLLRRPAGAQSPARLNLAYYFTLSPWRHKLGDSDERASTHARAPGPHLRALWGTRRARAPGHHERAAVA